MILNASLSVESCSHMMNGIGCASILKVKQKQKLQSDKFSQITKMDIIIAIPHIQKDQWRDVLDHTTIIKQFSQTQKMSTSKGFISWYSVLHKPT